MNRELEYLQAALVAAAPPELDLAFRPMFGGVMAYAGGAPFASLSNVGLGLKLVGAEHAAALQMEGAVPLRYAPDDPPSKSYVVVPRTILEDPQALRLWVLRSAATAKPSARRSRKKAD